MPWPPLPDVITQDTDSVLELAMFDDLIGESVTSGADTILWDEVGADPDDENERSAEVSVETASEEGVTGGSEGDSPERKKARKRAPKKRR
jgi:hypothetical protein